MSKRQGIQLCYPFEEKRLLSWEPPWIVQPKLDGERCRAVFSGDDNRGYVLLSSELNEIISVPHITQALNDLHFEFGITDELDGELYCHGMALEQIHSRIGRTVNLHSEHEQIEYHIFDLVSHDSQYLRSLRLAQAIEWSKLANWPLKRVPFFVCETMEDLWERYVHFLNTGYEGIIVRHLSASYERKRSRFVMKFKPKKSDWYTVVGATEEVDKNGQPKNALGALVCESDGERFTVGSGLTRSQREQLWSVAETLPGRLCHVQYQHSTPGRGVPRFPVFVEIVKGEF